MRGLWRRVGFRKLWLVETIARFGSQVSDVALPLALFAGT
jgi:hypothetical protein